MESSRLPGNLQPHVIHVQPQARPLGADLIAPARLDRAVPTELPAREPRPRSQQASLATSTPRYHQADTSTGAAACSGALHVQHSSRCSAAAIGTRLVLTAGHCVLDADRAPRWPMVFLPRYWGNAAPWQYWIKFFVTVSALTQRPTYTEPEWDYALLVTDYDMSGQISHLPVDTAFVAEENTPITVYGYPSGLDGGNIMYQETDVGGAISGDAVGRGVWSELVGLSNNGYEGISGGPWVSPGGSIIGVTSGKGAPGALASPLFQGTYAVPFNTMVRIAAAATWGVDRGLDLVGFGMLTGSNQLSDGDMISVAHTGTAPENMVKIGLCLGPNVTWWKGIYLDDREIVSQEERHGSVYKTVNAADLSSMHLNLRKAKGPKIYRAMHAVYDAFQWMQPGNQYLFTWWKD